MSAADVLAKTKPNNTPLVVGPTHYHAVDNRFDNTTNVAWHNGVKSAPALLRTWCCV